MKNQNDLIFSIVFGVLGLVAFGIALATKPEPQPIATPPTITTAAAALPATAVSYGNALPSASGSTAGGMGGGMGGRMGGYPGGPGMGGGRMGGGRMGPPMGGER